MLNLYYLRASCLYITFKLINKTFIENIYGFILRWPCFFITAVALQLFWRWCVLHFSDPNLALAKKVVHGQSATIKEYKLFSPCHKSIDGDS